jgi:hypothetical protein
MSTRTHRLRVPWGVPGILPRLVVIALVAVGVSVLVPFPLWRAVALAAALVAVVVPRTLAAWAAAACIPIGMLLTEPLPGRTALAMLLVHAIHLLASLSLTIPVSSRLSMRALLPALGRFAAVQLIAQPLAYGAQLLTDGGRLQDAGWLAPVAAGALLLGLVLALRALRRADAAAAEPSDVDARG